MSIHKRATALAAAVGFVAAWSLAWAAEPTQADFDACNREAQAKASSPAASPRTAPEASGGIRAEAPGAPAPRGQETQAPRDQGKPGATGPTGAPGMGGASGGVSGGVSGGASGTAGAELRGMAAAGMSNPAYQAAYRDCLKRRGF